MRNHEKHPLPKDRQEEFDRKVKALDKFIVKLLLNIVLSAIATVVTLYVIGAI